MTTYDLSHAQWQKSSRSSANGQCVELADLADAVAMRDTKDPAGPALIFHRDSWMGFLAGVKAGAFKQR